ncbi:30S ribosomal protein S12 methylthiotransferase RimO [Persephonella sp.]
MKVAVVSLGCPKNLVDTEIILGKLSSCSVAITKDFNEADVILINTCGFIDEAKEESINTILEAVQYKNGVKDKKIVVAGCLVERYKDELKKELPEVDLFVDLKEELLIPEKLGIKNVKFDSPYQNRLITTPKHTAYLKISEGCDHTCSFCAIPQIRGKHRSRTVEDILLEVKRLADLGVKELNIVSQDTSYYGVDLYGKPMLWDLISKIEKIDGIKWIRLFYLYPTTINEDFIKKMVDSEKVVKYFEMPIQHSEDKILKDMMRGYRKNRIEKILEWKDKYIPEAAVRTSVIVGYPTETEEDFNKLKEFIKYAKFDWLGVFKYSHEEGTPAFKEYDDLIPEDEKISRKNELINIQEKITEEKNRFFVGKQMEVLIDGYSEEWETLPIGRTYRSGFEIDGIVYIETDEPITVGEFAKVKIKDTADQYDVVGTLCEK